MKTRYNMHAKTGEYVEATNRAELAMLRALDSRFRYCRIRHAVQVWDDIIRTGTIYPSWVNSRTDFIKHNTEIDRNAE